MPLGINPRIWFVLMLVLLTSMAIGSSALAQEVTPAGTWVAKVPSPQGEVEVTLFLNLSDDGWYGTLKGRTRTVDLKNVTVTGNMVEFAMPNPDLPVVPQFSGSLGTNGNRIAGIVSAPNYPNQEFIFIRQIDEVVTEDGGKKYRVGSGPAGVWIGKVQAPDGEDSQVTLTLDKSGSDWMATIEDPFVNMVRGEDIKVTDTMISFTFRPQDAPFPYHFSGTYIAAEDRVTGSFSQRGSSRFVKFLRDPGTVTLGLGPDGEPIKPPRVRHDYKFAITGRISFWSSFHVVKDEVYNINTLTQSAWNYDGAFKWFVLDGFNIFLRGYHGGQNFTDEQSRLDNYADIGLNSESYLKLDGWEIGVMGYLGNSVTPNSNFNPYLTAAVGTTSWELTAGGRGTEVLALDDQPFTGSDFSVAGGLGTEYQLSRKFCLEFDILWRYILTEDTELWPDVDNYWSNTHSWTFSLGLTYGF